MDKDVLMSQQESIAPGQASRFITAERRRAMAEESVRILGHKRTLPSALEVAAAEWEREREARAKQAQEEKLSRAAQAPPFSLQRVALRAEDLPPADEALWKVCIPPQPQRKPALRPRRLGGIAVGSFATRLIQKARAGGSGIAMDPRARALEEAARRWAQGQASGNPRR